MNDVRFEMNRSNRMNIGRIALFIVQAMVLVPLVYFGAHAGRDEPACEDSRGSGVFVFFLRHPDPNEVVRVPDYTNPDVFFTESEVGRVVARRKGVGVYFLFEQRAVEGRLQRRVFQDGYPRHPA